MSDEASGTFNQQIQAALRRELISAAARADAFRLAWDSKGEVGQIRQEIAEAQELLQDARWRSGPMAPGATPHIYKTAYLRGLQDALELIMQLIESEK